MTLSHGKDIKKMLIDTKQFMNPITSPFILQFLQELQLVCSEVIVDKISNVAGLLTKVLPVPSAATKNGKEKKKNTLSSHR